MLPFFMVPAVYAMYEYFEFQKGYMNEVCRPAHLTALAYGVIFGLAFRRFVLWERKLELKKKLREICKYLGCLDRL